MVGLDLASTGGRYLDEGETVFVIGHLFEKLFYGGESFQDSFGVVEPVDSDADIFGFFDANGRQDFLDLDRFGFVFPRESDTYWERFDHAPVGIFGDGELFQIDQGLELSSYGFYKVVAVELGMESNQVGAQHPVEDFLAIRADTECFRVWPGNVPKDADLSVGPGVFDYSR
jgi:hypothetical protein